MRTVGRGGSSVVRGAVGTAGSRVTIGAATTKQDSACTLTGQITLARRNPAVMLARLSINGVVVDQRAIDSTDHFVVTVPKLPAVIRLAAHGYQPLEFEVASCISPVDLYLALAEKVTPVLASLQWVVGDSSDFGHSYRLLIYEDGWAKWFLGVGGPDVNAYDLLTPTQLLQVKQAFVDSGFERLSQEQSCEVDDAPAFALGLKTELGFKTLYTSYISCTAQEELLYELITRIEHIVQAERWVGPFEYRRSAFLPE